MGDHLSDLIEAFNDLFLRTCYMFHNYMLDERSSYTVNGIELVGPLCVMPDRMALIALPFYWIKNGGYPMTSARTVQFFYHSANDGFMSAARTIDMINDDL